MPYKDADQRKANVREWKLEHKERVRELNKASYERHKSEIHNRRRTKAALADTDLLKERQRLYSKTYRERHRSEIRARAAAKYVRKPKVHKRPKPARILFSVEERQLRARQASKRWRLKNIARVKARNRAWHVANREHRNQQALARYRANPDKYRLWAMAHYARKQQTTTEPIDYNALILRDRNHCGICGKDVAENDRSFDHILPLSKGGTHTANNLRLTHLICNKQRGNRPPAQPRLIG